MANVKHASGGAAALWISLRPRQWVKNLFLFAALIFATRLTDVECVLRAVAAFTLFCLSSSAVYLLNDTIDRERDRLHPGKRKRPIADGLLAPRAALAWAAGLAAVSVAGAAMLGSAFLYCTLGYLLLQLLYSLALKKVPIVDMLAVASGFVVRAVAGGLAIDVYISPWLMTCTFLLAFFLVVGKRRQESRHLGDAAADHRQVLRLPAGAYDRLGNVAAVACILAYAAYTLFSHQPQALVLTLPFVGFGFYRYLRLVRQHDLGEDPTVVIWEDRVLQATLTLWVATAAAILYLS